jgi:hypothetical protein
LYLVDGRFEGRSATAVCSIGKKKSRRLLGDRHGVEKEKSKNAMDWRDESGTRCGSSC